MGQTTQALADGINLQVDHLQQSQQDQNKFLNTSEPGYDKMLSQVDHLQQTQGNKQCGNKVARWLTSVVKTICSCSKVL
jgi:hypothetical protein